MGSEAGVKSKAALIIAAVLGAVALAAAAAALWPREQLVVYTSVDSVYSRPVADLFEIRTGIRVTLVPDAESAKTTGLYQRLLAEKRRPRADVFWNSEISRTLLLARQGLLAAYRPKAAGELASEFRGRGDLWHGFACRARIIIYNRNLVKPEELPKSIFDLTGPHWKGKVAVAYPLFGTTATHCAALRAEFGRARTNDFLKALVANGVKVVNGNGIVAELVAAGSAALGLTDTDDAWAQIDAGKPVGMVYPDQGEGGLGTLVIPNTAGRVAGGPHPEAAAKFLDFLCSAPVEAVLAQPPARHMPTPGRGLGGAPDAKSLTEIRPMKVEWERVADEVERQSEDLEKIFPR